MQINSEGGWDHNQPSKILLVIILPITKKQLHSPSGIRFIRLIFKTTLLEQFEKMIFIEKIVVVFVVCLMVQICLQPQMIHASSLPTQPSIYRTRSSVPAPFLAYSFRQTDCESGRFTPDIGQTSLHLTRLQDATFCPSQTVLDTTFENARIGVTVDNVGEPNAIKSLSSIGTAFDSVTTTTTESSMMSIEIWFSHETTPVDNSEYTLVEIGK